MYAHLLLITEGKVGGGLRGSHTLSRFGSSGVWCGWVVEQPPFLSSRSVEDVSVIFLAVV